MSVMQPEKPPVWVPTAESFNQTQLSDFISYVKKVHPEADLSSEFDVPDGTALHRFSVRRYRDFWRLFLEWSAVSWTGDATTVCRGDRIEDAAFFPDVELSYADILLTERPGLGADLPALVACHPDRPPVRLTRGQLRRRVAEAAMALADLDIGPGSRVAVVARNDADAAIAVLAAAALGATIATATPDIGAAAMLEQLSQVEPVALLCQLNQPFAAAREQMLERVTTLTEGLPSLRRVVALDHGAAPQGLRVPLARLADGMAGKNADDFVWRRFPFNHPLFVLSTSGTTGRAKCIVHGAGGTLIEHLKEHRLHCDLAPGDTMFFQTSPAWMMWHWQLSALASGAAIVLNAAPVSGPETLWRIVAEEAVTVFGTTPAYFQLCEALGYTPSAHFEFGSLRAVLSTGSVLHEGQQEWLSRHVKDLPIQSISGGSDIIGCFVLGSPMVPAYAAECMSRSLGLDVQALAAPGSDVPQGAGELICANPFPSRPLGFLNDPDGARFHAAYFARNPGVWTHGDLIEFTPRGSARMLGRSDSVMNIRGIRIGPADIYRAIADIAEVRAGLAVERAAPDVPGGAVIVLAVVLADGVSPDPALFARIARIIGQRASPTHVPSIILDVPELPVTNSGKLSERALRDAVNGRPPANLGSLRNPECLAAIAAHPALAAAAAAPNRTPGPTLGPTPDPTGDAAGGEADLTESVRAIWETVLRRGPIGPDDDFFDLGGDSLATIELLLRIETVFGLHLPITLIYEAPTVAAMAAFIAARKAPSFATLVPLKPGDGTCPLFIVHGIGGTVMELVGVGRLITQDGAVYAVQARGLDGVGRPNARVEDMARDYLEAIREARPHGPYHLAGYSFGGLVAFEMARMLRAAGETVGYLCLLDTTLHQRHWSRWLWAATFLGRMRVHLGQMRRMSGPEAARYGRQRISALLRHAAQRFGGAPPEESFYAETGLPPALQAVRDAALTAFADYRPEPYDGTVTLIKTTDLEGGRCDPVRNWRGVARRLRVREMPGGHRGLVRPPVVELVARTVSADLAAAMPPGLDVAQAQPQPAQPHPAPPHAVRGRRERAGA